MTADVYGFPVPIGWVALGLLVLAAVGVVHLFRRRGQRRFEQEFGSAMRYVAGTKDARGHEQLP